eukprot:GSA120T00005298001.1
MNLSSTVRITNNLSVPIVVRSSLQMLTQVLVIPAKGQEWVPLPWLFPEEFYFVTGLSAANMSLATNKGLQALAKQDDQTQEFGLDLDTFRKSVPNAQSRATVAPTPGAFAPFSTAAATVFPQEGLRQAENVAKILANLPWDIVTAQDEVDETDMRSGSKSKKNRCHECCCGESRARSSEQHVGKVHSISRDEDGMVSPTWRQDDLDLRHKTILGATPGSDRSSPLHGSQMTDSPTTVGHRDSDAEFEADLNSRRRSRCSKCG